MVNKLFLLIRRFQLILGRLWFHYDNNNEYENDNEISLSFLYTKRWTAHRFYFVIYYNDNE